MPANPAKVCTYRVVAFLDWKNNITHSIRNGSTMIRQTKKCQTKKHQTKKRQKRKFWKNAEQKNAESRYMEKKKRT
jgi:hypothetical protein